MRFLRLLTLSLLAYLVALSPSAAIARENTHPGTPGIVSLGELPDEARATLALIKQGGPFPYRRDGIEFQNRERRLPTRPDGFYREYTVPTPGAPDRGPRRIIAGEDRSYFYTADHYRSFRRISP